MGYLRTMGAGGVSTSKLYGNANINGNQGGGDKLQGLPPLTGARRPYKVYKAKAGGNAPGRFTVFCLNQLGGIGMRNKNSQFAPNADGVKDCMFMPNGKKRENKKHHRDPNPDPNPNPDPRTIDCKNDQNRIRIPSARLNRFCDVIKNDGIKGFYYKTGVAFTPPYGVGADTRSDASMADKNMTVVFAGVSISKDVIANPLPGRAASCYDVAEIAATFANKPKNKINFFSIGGAGARTTMIVEQRSQNDSSRMQITDVPIITEESQNGGKGVLEWNGKGYSITSPDNTIQKGAAEIVSVDYANNTVGLKITNDNGSHDATINNIGGYTEYTGNISKQDLADIPEFWTKILDNNDYDGVCFDIEGIGNASADPESIPSVDDFQKCFAALRKAGAFVMITVSYFGQKPIFPNAGQPASNEAIPYTEAFLKSDNVDIFSPQLYSWQPCDKNWPDPKDCPESPGGCLTGWDDNWCKKDTAGCYQQNPEIKAAYETTKAYLAPSIVFDTKNVESINNLVDNWPIPSNFYGTFQYCDKY